MESTINPVRSTSFVIDSRDRDRVRFPLASHYEISLDEAVHDVFRMELLVADVPFAAYLIQATNNTVQAVMTSNSPPTNIMATIPVGDYLPSELAEAVAVALQSATSSSQYQFSTSYSTLTDNISVSCTQPFDLVFDPTGSVALELGFVIGSTNVAATSSSGSDYVVTPPYRRNANLHPSVVLRILPASVNTSINQNTNQSFAIITPTRAALCAASRYLSRKTFHPPVARFSRFAVDFSNYDGTPVDFQNQDHRLEILLTSLRAAKYMRFDGLPTS